MLTLEFKKRQEADKLPKLRREGFVPAVFYGPKEETTPISIKAIDFKKVWKEVGESSVISLKDGSEEHEALIYAVDEHPVSGIPRHADFYVIEKGKKIQVKTPLEFIGTSAAIKELGGTLVKVLHELEIEALPKDLPHDLKVDISLLAALDSQVLAKDIKLPDGVTLISEPDEVVASIFVPQEEPEEAPEASIADIEVVGAKGKEEVVGEEGAAPAAPEAKQAKE
ncbi:50S ribosomal protein L25 [Candidatus Parcubacteria bacterium]|nr:50S ribosomal protein L25 [Candidatus Parcubacteria bacterium]